MAGLIRVLVLGVLGYMAWRILKAQVAPMLKQGGAGGALSGQLVQDPQCKVYVARSEAVEVKTRSGSHFFCSDRCAQAYMKEHG